MNIEQIRDSRPYRSLISLSFPSLVAVLGVACATYVATFYFYYLVLPDQAEVLLQDKLPPELVSAMMVPWRTSIRTFGLIAGCLLLICVSLVAWLGWTTDNLIRLIKQAIESDKTSES